MYRDIIQQFIALLKYDKYDGIFQQDGVSAHTACKTMAFSYANLSVSA